jgi:hypothetical protein
MRPVAQIAQSVEQGIENPRVGGSIPSLGTKNTEKPLHRKIQGFFLRSKKCLISAPHSQPKSIQHSVCGIGQFGMEPAMARLSCAHTPAFLQFSPKRLPKIG